MDKLDCGGGRSLGRRHRSPPHFSRPLACEAAPSARPNWNDGTFGGNWLSGNQSSCGFIPTTNLTCEQWANYLGTGMIIYKKESLWGAAIGSTHPKKFFISSRMRHHGICEHTYWTKQSGLKISSVDGEEITRSTMLFFWKTFNNQRSCVGEMVDAPGTLSKIELSS
jgi:hypothetical protein